MRKEINAGAARKAKPQTASALQTLKNEEIADQMHEARAILSKEGVGKRPPKTAGQSAYDLAFTITINAIYNRVRALSRDDVESPFESGKQSDADAAWAMDLVTSEVTGMLGRSCDAEEFEVWLFRMDGVIRCVYNSLSNKDTFYARQLASIKTAIGVFGEMMDDVGRLGDKFLQREVSA